MAQLGIVPQPTGGMAVLKTPEPHTVPGKPNEGPAAVVSGPHPETNPFSPNPGPKKFAIEGDDTRSNAKMQRAVTRPLDIAKCFNAFLPLSFESN
jgi:hypothetical protein